MTARRALLEDVEFDPTAGEFAPARRALVESDELVTTAVLPKYEAQRAFAKPVPTRATRRNRALIGAGLAAAAVLVPFVMPVHAEYAKAPQSADLAETTDVAMFDLQEIAAADASTRAQERREEAARQAEAQRLAEEEARRQAEEEARRQTEAERQAAQAAQQRAAQAQRAQDQAASRSADRPAAAAPQQEVVASGDAAGAINFALAQSGKPYIWGGNGPDGYDCSGLVQAAYRSIGISLPRTAAAMAGVGRPVSVAEMQPGDIIVSYGGGHASIYIGNGQIVHASTYGVPIGTAPLSHAGNITSVRRVVG